MASEGHAYLRLDREMIINHPFIFVLQSLQSSVEVSWAELDRIELPKRRTIGSIFFQLLLVGLL